MVDRILVVDDDPDQCLAFETALETLGFEVESNTNPTCALGLARSGSFHLVLTDLEMPSLPGLDLCAQLATEFPR